MNYGLLSIIPPVIAIVLAIKTKQVYLALLAGLWLGYLILADWSPFHASIDVINAVVSVFGSMGNTRTILFTLLMGSLIQIMHSSGGVKGFVRKIEQWLLKRNSSGIDKQRVIVQLMVVATGMFLFIESSISILTSGTIFKPIFKKIGIPEEKLAYLIDSTSAPSSILMPVNAWGAYIMSLLLMQGFEQPLVVMLKAMVFNFYPVAAVFLTIIIIAMRRDIGPMKYKWKLKGSNYKSEQLTEIAANNQEGRAKNMIIPLGLMVVLVPFFQVYTGWGFNDIDHVSFGKRIFNAVSNGSGSASVLYAVSIAVVVAAFQFLLQKKSSVKSVIDHALKGMEPMLAMAGLMVLAFAMGDLCKLLGTGNYIASVAGNIVSPAVIPAVIFVIGGFIAFSTGTSWGTFAIMIPIVVPLAEATGANVYMGIAAVMGGGVFGDHCSPISDTTLLASMSSGSDHIEHVRTQLPYALLAGGVAIVLYILLGLVLN